jgi:hypothetical protein
MAKAQKKRKTSRSTSSSSVSKGIKNFFKKKLWFIYYPVLGVYYIVYYACFCIYWLVKGFYMFFRWFYGLFRTTSVRTAEYVQKKKIEKSRSAVKAQYEKFNIVEHDSGDFQEFEKKLIKSDSTIGLVLGARGSGKTAIAVKMLENIYAKTKKSCYAMGFKEEDMPIWIDVVEDIKEIKNNSFVLIDEGGILFSSRRSMAEPNKLLSELMFIARHKNMSIIFISQNSANLEINAIRQADYLVLKTSSLLQKDFERAKIKDIYEAVSEKFRQYKKIKGITYIYSDEFTGFVENPLPSFWTKKISKAFSKETDEEKED